MKNSSRTPSYLIFAIVVCLASIAAYWYIYHSVQREVALTVNALDSVQKEKNIKDREKNIAATIASTEDERIQIAGVFVPEDKIVKLIERLEMLGDQSHTDVSVSAISADDLSLSAKDTVGRIAAHVSGMGSWVAVMKMLQLAENLPYSSTIDRLRLDHVNSDAKTGSKWRIDFDIEVLSIK